MLVAEDNKDSASESSLSSRSSSPSFIDEAEVEAGMNPENSDYAQLFEDSCIMMDDYIMDNLCKVSKPEFHDDLTAYLFEQLRIVLFASVGDTHVIDSVRAHSLIYRIIENVSIYYFDQLHTCNPHRFMPVRSSFVRNDENDEKCNDDNDDNDNNATDIIAEKVQRLIQQQNQTEQRTDAWYARRHSLITASSAWKVFGTDSVVNQLIYEKCKPYVSSTAGDDSTQPFVNVESPLHWGQKYEYLSAEIYQRRNNTRLGEFGCIQHSDPRFSFLGGSPDGINIDELSPLFGRMVEIKNIVNRDITGIPKEEYWIQMQIQMETCDMDACDFVETRFVEYEDPQDYYDDVQIDCTYSGGTNSSCWGDDDGDNAARGIIIYFVDLETRKPHYVYMPFEYTDVDIQEAWIINTISRFETDAEKRKYVWIRNIYWKLDQYSCVLVRRNRVWFSAYAASRIEAVWRTIEMERVSGYAHRAPKKRIVSMPREAMSASSRNGNNGNGNGNGGGTALHCGCGIVL